MVRAKRSLGQNFLVDPNIQRKIVDALEAGPADEVLEIGPGMGALTQHLAGRVGRLVLVELDDRLFAELERGYAADPSVDVVHASILDVDPARLARGDVARLKVIGNIPYNITTPILFHLLEPGRRPERIVVMIQREVADRILAPPGGKEYGALSVGIRAVADVQRLFNVSRNAFHPAPDVMSTVIRITPRRPAPLEPAEEADLRTLTRVAFAWRRKQLQKTLRSAPEYGLDAAGVEAVAEETRLDLDARPETLPPEAFIRLSRALRGRGLPLHPE
ncbi:MAG TPA: 16S rRNA (adenine(1518)-N(6)/adenine(1519)-N(6))-dimethyltransferase RsmA [Longimicrobiales bacterium]|nr:16S rRNA (adenine(1518)-N(6)/adenine(1519)-N(6))-dimethyltransferase RsmA [Longimicrobiales bacterium]